MLNITDLFLAFAETQKVIEEFKAELPAEFVLSTRNSWDGKSLDGYATAHPEILPFKKETVVATVRRLK